MMWVVDLMIWAMNLKKFYFIFISTKHSMTDTLLLLSQATQISSTTSYEYTLSQVSCTSTGDNIRLFIKRIQRQPTQLSSTTIPIPNNTNNSSDDDDDDTNNNICICAVCIFMFLCACVNRYLLVSLKIC